MEITSQYLQRIHPSFHPAYEGLTQLLLESPQPVECLVRKPVIAGNPNTTQFLADDLWWDAAPPVFGVLNDSGNGCSVTITGAPFCDRILGMGSSDAITFMVNLLHLLVDAQRTRRPYLGLPARMAQLREDVGDHPDEAAIAGFAQSWHDALDHASPPEHYVEKAQALLRRTLGDCWQELEEKSRHRLSSGESFFQAFRDMGELSFAGATVEYIGAIEIELDAKLFQPFRDQVNKSGELSSILTRGKERFLKPYVDPSRKKPLSLGQMSRILRDCPQKSERDPLLGALMRFVNERCGDSGFWFSRFPAEGERIADLRNGAAHKDAVPTSRSEEFRTRAHGLQGTSPICQIVHNAAKTDATGLSS